MSQRFRHGPMAFLSGLSPTNPGGRSAAWSPTNPPAGNGASLQPTNPPRGRSASWQPTNPPRGRSASWQPTNPPKKRSWIDDGDAVDVWEGVDAPWTYAEDDALLAQALRKSRLKTLRASDAAQGQLRPAPSLAPLPASDPMAALWRWAPPFRVAAAVAELGARLPVQGTALWHSQGEQPPAQPGTQVLQAEVLFAIDPAQLAQVDWTNQIDKVLRAAVEREDRLPEILTQASDLWPFYESITGLARELAPAADDLMQACDTWILQVIMLLKHHVAAIRPHQRSSLVLPVIETPGHGSVPSGHATVAAFTSRLLVHLLDPLDTTRRALLDRLARRIAFNRVVAGVHCPVDNRIGYELGRTMADAVAVLAGASSVHAPLWGQPGAWLSEPELRESDDEAPPPVGSPPAWAPSELLTQLWRKARTEVAALRV